MKRKYFYDITDFRLALGITHDEWDVEEIQNLDEFRRWVGDDIEIVESHKRIEGIPEINFKEIERIEGIKIK